MSNQHTKAIDTIKHRIERIVCAIKQAGVERDDYVTNVKRIDGNLAEAHAELTELHNTLAVLESLPASGRKAPLL